MASLFHYVLCPFSRKVRLLFSEYKQEVELVDERPWERRLDFLMLNPSGEVPVLMLDSGMVAGHYAITEWMHESVATPYLMADDPMTRAEIRRLTAWFDDKFNTEVGQLIVHEKIDRRFMGAQYGGGDPDINVVRAGLHNLNMHFSYMQHLLDQRDWLAGDQLSLADITAAAHISCVDYTGDIAWQKWPEIRDWYARIKSRPCFRPLLADHIAGFKPPAHYVDLDF